jgi:Trk K+ transport system NAD-binding subunit
MEILEGGGLDPSEVRLPRLINLLRFGETIPVAEGEGMLVAVNIRPGSHLAGRTVARTIGTMEGATAVAVLRGEQMLTPRGDTLFEEGDQLLLVTTPDTHRLIVRQAEAPLEQ